MKVISSEKLPIKMWLDEIEDGAVEQAKNLANLPFAFKWVSIMPDSHQGYGMPIGGVLATKKVVIPNAVGVDIGCGMCAVNTGLQSITKQQLTDIVNDIKKFVPVGFNHHKEKREEWLTDDQKGDLMGSVIEQQYQSSLTQIGTLGGVIILLKFKKVLMDLFTL